MTKKDYIAKTIILSTLSVLFLHASYVKGQELTPQQPDTLLLEEELMVMPLSDWEYIPDLTYYEIEERLACIDAGIPLSYNETVKAFIDYFTVRNRAYTKLMIQRHQYYFPLFEKYLKEYNLPDELKYLAIIESGLNPKAVSRAGAVGMWQFMPRTARLEFGLTEDWYIDEKMDIEKSTEAACRYLSFLYNYFNDWELALAAYNSGPGNVRKAIRQSGYKKGFWEVYPYLKRETRSYVPQFVAMIYTMNYLEEHNFVLENLQRPYEIDTILFDGFVHLKPLAEQSGVCLEDLQKLNPELRKNAVPPYAKSYPLKVPALQAALIRERKDELALLAATDQEEFEKMARNTPGSVYGREKITHTVRSGDVLGKIANQYGVRVSDLQAWNNMRGTTIYVGQRLNVWILPAQQFKGQQSFSKVQTKTSSQTALTKNDQAEYNEQFYTVQPGDTLWDISRKFDGLTVDKIKQLNQLRNNQIKPGMQLKIGDS